MAGRGVGSRGGWPLLALGAWSVLTWAGRVRNIFDDAELSGSERLVWLVPALVFVLGGVVTLWAWWRGGRALRSFVAAFAVWSIGYWALRMVLLVGNGHSVGFVVVHAVLAAVAVALSVAVLGRLRRPTSVPPAPSVPATGTAR